MFYDVDSIFSTIHQKEEVKIKSCVTTLIRQCGTYLSLGQQDQIDL